MAQNLPKTARIPPKRQIWKRGGADRGGGSPAASKNRGKGPPFAPFFDVGFAVGGTLQNHAFSTKALFKNPPKDKNQPFLTQIRDFGPWFYWPPGIDD